MKKAVELFILGCVFMMIFFSSSLSEQKKYFQYICSKNEYTIVDAKIERIEIISGVTKGSTFKRTIVNYSGNTYKIVHRLVGDEIGVNVPIALNGNAESATRTEFLLFNISEWCGDFPMLLSAFLSWLVCLIVIINQILSSTIPDYEFLFRGRDLDKERIKEIINLCEDELNVTVPIDFAKFLCEVDDSHLKPEFCFNLDSENNLIKHTLEFRKQGLPKFYVVFEITEDFISCLNTVDSKVYQFAVYDFGVTNCIATFKRYIAQKEIYCA